MSDRNNTQNAEALATLIAHEISARFYLCTDKGIGGDVGYSPYWVDEDDAVKKLIEIILPLLPNVADEPQPPKN